VRRPALFGSARRAAQRAVGNLRSQRGREQAPVSPPHGEGAQAPGSFPPPPADRPRPAVIAVDVGERADEPTPEPAAPREPQLDSAGRPMPVHVPYARSSRDSEVVSAPSAPRAPRPVRSPFWAAVRSHLWLGTIIVVLAGGAGTAYWGLRVHQRISEASIERDVGGREHSSAIRCVEQQSNGSVWACGLVYQAASVCLIADVNPVGDWTTKDGTGLCDNRPELMAILPSRVTASAVAADMQSRLVMADARCARAPGTSVRWACLGPGSDGGGGDCLLVRVAPWTGLASDQSDVCAHVPALRKHNGKA
jgi:hypothetical protein